MGSDSGYTDFRLTVTQIGGELGIYTTKESGGITSGDFLCSISAKDGVSQRQARARRLVACWNACEGVPTEYLEKCVEHQILGIISDPDERP